MPMVRFAGPRLAFLAAVAFVAGAAVYGEDDVSAVMHRAVCEDIAALTVRAQGTLGHAARNGTAGSAAVQPVTAGQCLQAVQRRELAPG